MGGAGPRSCRARHFKDDRVAATAARADRGHAETAAAATQLFDQTEDNAGAAGPDGVAKCDGAAIHIDAARVDTKSLAGDDGNTGKGFIDLPDVDVRRFESSSS